MLSISSRRATDPGSVHFALPVSPGEVVWAGLVPRSLARALHRGVVLQGVPADRGYRVSDIFPPQGPERRPLAMPLDTELLPQLEVTPFGREDRVTVERESGRIALQCRPGDAPAGLVLRGGPWYLPEGIDLQLVIECAGAGDYEWAVSDLVRAGNGAPLSMGRFAAAAAAHTVVIPVPREGLSRAAWAQWSLICPNSGGVFTLTSVKLMASNKVAVPRDRALWAWPPSLWQRDPEPLLARLRQLDARVVYVTVPVDLAKGRVEQPEKLAAFVTRAAAAGVRVWAVVGDPRALFPRERRKFIRRAWAFCAYNASVPTFARLTGIQYDVEPYLLPGYTLSPEAWAEAYLATMWELKHAAPLPLEAALPFWYASQKLRGQLLLDRLASCVDSLVVMDYRTDPALVQQFAEPFLAWGLRHGRPVRVALEAGPIGDEVRRHYRPDTTGGQLWLTCEGGRYLLVLLRDPRRSPIGASFRYTHTSIFPGSILTFRDRRPELAAQMTRLEEQFDAWPSFIGWALHGLDDLDQAARGD